MIINCIIIDDEPLARKGLKEYITEVDFLQLAGEYEHPLKAAGSLSDGTVQLIFLDIQMPKITGLDFFKSLKNPPQVIFTTAYPQYALEGFNVAALDYLVKPISLERFLKAAMKAKEYFEVRLSNRLPSTENNTAKNYFFIKVDGKMIKIFYDDILFIEALQNYVNIYTANNKYITYLTLLSAETYLPPDLFIKTHKSYIVAAAKVDSIEVNEIIIGNHKIPISRNLKEDVTKKLIGNKFLKR